MTCRPFDEEPVFALLQTGDGFSLAELPSGPVGVDSSDELDPLVGTLPVALVDAPDLNGDCCDGNHQVASFQFVKRARMAQNRNCRLAGCPSWLLRWFTGGGDSISPPPPLSQSGASNRGIPASARALARLESLDP